VTVASRLASLVRGQLTREFVAFCVVGSVAFLTTDAGSNVLHFKVGLDPLSSNAIATVAGMVVAFTGNRYWTFSSRQRTGMRREGALFVVFNLIALLIQLACIGFTSYVLGLNGRLDYNVALVIGIGVGTLFRFWSYRTWVWHVTPPAEVAPPEARPSVRT
jgi:putative flippase GtrA